jgi:hypothetical protein
VVESHSDDRSRFPATRVTLGFVALLAAAAAAMVWNARFL